MSADAVRLRREALERIRDRRNHAVALLDSVHAQWWRLIRNRGLLRQSRTLLAANAMDWAVVETAWEGMSISERTAAELTALRAAAGLSPSHSGRVN